MGVTSLTPHSPSVGLRLPLCGLDPPVPLVVQTPHFHQISLGQHAGVREAVTRVRAAHRDAFALWQPLNFPSPEQWAGCALAQPGFHIKRLPAEPV